MIERTKADDDLDITVNTLRLVTMERDEAMALLRDHRRAMDKMLKGASGASHHAEQALNASDDFLNRIDPGCTCSTGPCPRCKGNKYIDGIRYGDAIVSGCMPCPACRGPWSWDKEPSAHPNCDRPDAENHVPLIYYGDSPRWVVARVSDFLDGRGEQFAETITEACNSHDSLTSEVEKLRKALRRIANTASATYDELQNVARAALGKGE